MGYPDNMDFPAIDRDAPEVVIRALDPAEVALIAMARRIKALVAELAAMQALDDDDGLATDARNSIEIDAPFYCDTLIAEIEALPQSEADAWECHVLREEEGE